MKEMAATNGHRVTSKKKTQVSLELLEQGMRLLQANVKIINEDCLGDIKPTYVTNNSGWEPSCSFSLQKLDFHHSAVCPRLWHDFEGIFKKNN